MFTPELLAPGGSLERLKVAVLYGADAVYLGGQKYGLRARADNFSNSELIVGVEFAHKHGAKVFITLNSYMHDDDFEGFAEFTKFLEEINVDAAIVSDLGVLRAVKKNSDLECHLSTQTSCLNIEAAKLWKSFGVKRVILGREVGIQDAGIIKEQAEVEVEVFIHGALCMAYSGNCTISNFTAGRDSNRGGCVHSCRFPYEQTLVGIGKSTSDTQKNHFMSSKDLSAIAHTRDYFDYQIDSLKVEGRMKSLLYIGTIIKSYRTVLDAHTKGTLSEEVINSATKELETFPHRSYCAGNATEIAGEHSVYSTNEETTEQSTHSYLGQILETSPNCYALQVVTRFEIGDVIEILPFKGDVIHYPVEKITTISGEALTQARQDSVVLVPKIPGASNIEALNVVRIKKN